LKKISNFLDQGVYNNWKSDTYDWRKEIVVVTGGSDGIGARIVKLLAERGITVAVLDIQGLKYDGKLGPYASIHRSQATPY
jgi:all-trans-retinol dehydrogenase (NAD+)